MSKYAVGDRVYLEAEIRQVDIEPYGVPYNVKFLNGATMWTDESNIFSISKTYEDGLNDAWELARKLVLVQDDGGYAISEIRNIFGTSNECKILRELSVQEAFEKLEAYEKSQQIQVGDVVYADGVQGVVIDIISDEGCYIYNENGCIEEHWFKDLKKTGRHIDIEHLLEQIRGDA